MNIFALAGLLIGVTSLSMAALMFLIGKEKLHHIWGLFCAAVAVWGFGAYQIAITHSAGSADFWWRVTHIGIIFIPVLFAHFVYEFLQFKRRIFIFVLYLLGFLFLATDFWGNLFIASMRFVFGQFYYDSPPGILYVPFTVFFFGLIAYSHFLLLRAYRISSPGKKTQISYFFLATAAGFLGGSLSFLPVYKIDLYPFGNLTGFLYPLIITYAILKKRLFDIKVILTQLLVAVIAVLLFINFIVSQTAFEFVWKGILLGTFLIAGYLLIKSVLKEVEQREKLEELSKAKSEFMSIASHQLRTPLSVVKGYASLLQEGSFGAVTEKQKEVLEKVFKTNEDMINMVNDLLNVTRAEEGRLQFSFEKTDARELIQNAVKALELQAKQKGLLLECALPEETLLIHADKEKITQVVSNLIDNAIKYTAKGGIRVVASKGKANGAAVISVQDTGLGIDKEEKEHLFESFSRGKAGTKSWAGGSGMGLYIAKQFVQAHNGKIWAESEGEGKGSTFFVELPLV